MLRFLLNVLSIFIFLLNVNMTVLADEIIMLGAGQAPTENILKPIKEPFEKATGIWLYFAPCGPKVALTEMEKGKFDAALAGLSSDDWMNYIEAERSPVKDPTVFHDITVGKDKIKALVNKKNPVSELTKEQLKKIFTGRITSWKEIGGKDVPIIVVWTRFLGGNYLFTKTILDGEPLTRNIFEVNTSVDARMKIASTQWAIGLGPSAIIDPSIKAPKIPEVARPITLITKGEPSANVQKLIDFINGEGKKYIKE